MYLKVYPDTIICSSDAHTPPVWHSKQVKTNFLSGSLLIVQNPGLKSIDYLCLSAVSVAMVTHSSANALPRSSVCKLMNSDWVNSGPDTTHGRQAFNSNWSGREREKDETEIETCCDKR